MTSVYLTRAQVAEHYPLSIAILAKLASRGTGPRFYKPIDKALYKAEDIDAWIEAAVVVPVSTQAPRPAPHDGLIGRLGGRGRAKPTKPSDGSSSRRGRKSLPPSAQSSLRPAE